MSLVCNDKTDFAFIRIGINIGPDRILFALLVIEFVRQCRQFGRNVTWLVEEKLMLLFFIILVASTFAFGAAFAPRNRYISKLFNFSIIPATLFIISRSLAFDVRSMRILRVIFLVIGLYLGVTGICEHFHFEALVFPGVILDPNFGIHFGRVRGPFGNAAVMGGALLVVSLWILWFHSNFRKSWITWVVVLPMLGSIYWTNTRAVWIQAAASIVILGFVNNPLRPHIRFLILVLTVVFFSGIASKLSAYQSTLFNRRHEQIDDRINIYHASWRMFLERPFLGFGYGNFLKYSDDYFEEIPGVELRGQGEGQHNTFLGLMCETGLVGTIPYAVVYFMFLRACYRRSRNAEPGDELGKSLAIMQFSILIGNLAGMQFSDFGFYNYINNLTFWSAGMVYARFEATGIIEFEKSAGTECELLPDAV